RDRRAGAGPHVGTDLVGAGQRARDDACPARLLCRDRRHHQPGHAMAGASAARAGVRAMTTRAGSLAVLPPRRRAPSRGALDRSSGAVVLSSRAGVALAAAFVASVVVAQVRAVQGQPSVVELLGKWTPLLAEGFLFNLLISFFAMLVGTVAGVLLGFARISLRPAVRGPSWIVVQFFRNAPWLVLLFFVMFLLPFEFHVGGTTIPFPDWINATLGLALPIMRTVAGDLRGPA